MKRTVLVILMMVMFVIPSFAEEVESDAAFSLNETLWSVTLVTLVPQPDEWLIGFYDGKVYVDARGVCGPQMGEPSFYVDLPGTSVFISNVPCCNSCNGSAIISGMLLPSGQGVMATVGIGYAALPLPFFNMFFLSKREDNWIPNGTE